ncbi:hypothetical protein KC317_g8014 [Hortaea werneckii]|nr:hypothetical protein KC317_g8014 [Hortaea werneckii]
MASTEPFDPFRALGVPRDASPTTIKERYRELARRYHPNRQQGSEESKNTLAEQFHVIHHAWRCLIDPEKRRRYLELLQLAEEQECLLTRMADLLSSDEQLHQSRSRSESQLDGQLSSDADEDELPYVGPVRRQTVRERATNHLSEKAEPKGIGRLGSLSRRTKSKGLLARAVNQAKNQGQDGDYFALRRKKLEKLRRKELAAFEQYKQAMMNKFEAEMQAERHKDTYERSKWKRDYFERAPRETTERLRSFQHFMSAYKAFGQQPMRPRNRSTLSMGSQILSTDDVHQSQYLAPDAATSPSKARHSRGWSSDVTGDQTSSDENSSGRSTTRPSVSWTWHKQHGRHTSLDAFELPLIMPSHQPKPQPAPDHAPFQMIVKRPTGFADEGNEQDSSPESALTSSRSASPHPSGPETGTYIIPAARRLSETLDSRRGRPSASASEDERVAPRGFNSTRSPPGNRTGDERQMFQMKHVGQPRYQHVAFNHVHLLSLREKSQVLGVEPEANTDPAELLARLAYLDHNVAEKFVVKPDAKASFNFRLIYDRPVTAIPDQPSFLALSYRRKLHVERQNERFTLPLDPEMFQAVWDERVSGEEGVWIDQICIDQENRTETTISMSAMDMVYRSARMVVVALDDIQLDAQEGNVLSNHMSEFAAMHHVAPNKRFRGKQPPYLDTHDDVYHVLRKLLRSSWFKRAWCRHEMRLARDHVFLVPCLSSATSSGRSVVRFTSGCLTHLLSLATEVPFEPDVEMVKPPLHAFFRDRSRLEPHDKRLHSHHGNFTTVVSEVFGMEAGGDPRIPAKQRAADAMKDKISIILNTMECGLALAPEMRDPSMPLTKAESYYMLLTLALAARDPGALCSVGPPMRLVQSGNISPLSPSASSTFLFEPSNVDAGLNNYRTLNRFPDSSPISTGLEGGEHFLQLDLQFLKPGQVRHGVEDAATLAFSEHFVDVCIRRKFGRNRQRYLISDDAANRHFGSMRDVYSQTLACVLECGPDWLEDVCIRYNVSRWRQDGEAAWNLLVALKSTDNRWPENAWSGKAAGFIMDFTNFLVIRGMPQRQILHREEWRPIWITTAAGGKVLTFIPPGSIRPAIPTALLDPDYIQLARLWILQPRLPLLHGVGHASQSAHWTLLGKSVIFSDDQALQQIHAHGRLQQKQQRVFGREDPEIQRLLRERSLQSF